MFKPAGSIFIITAVTFLMTCIDPYSPKLAGYDSLLVVDGLITDDNSSNLVKISRTFQEGNPEDYKISDATVFISDDTGTESYLNNAGDGIYKTDSTAFRGNVGRIYVLHILTKEGGIYESEPCLMQPVAAIDSIYFARDQKFVSNGTEAQDGVSIFLDSKSGDDSRYYRWTYDETWKFQVSEPKLYDYNKGPTGMAPIITPVKDIKEFCWKNRHSDEILIRSLEDGQSLNIQKQPVNFIATEESDRFMLQYSILVKQYSISKREYEFWNNLKQVNESGSDIFARQPYSVISNIHSTVKPKERVLGFFQVSAVAQKRKNIPRRDVSLMGLHFFTNQCRTWEFEPANFNTPCMCPPKTWDDVYWYLSIVSDYTFIRPRYQGLGTSVLVKLVFTRPECANCELNGTSVKPEFWTDL